MLLGYVIDIYVGGIRYVRITGSGIYLLGKKYWIFET